MTRAAVPILALVLGAALAVSLVSCGGRDKKGLLPGDNAKQILANLDTVEADAASGSCASAAEEVATIQDQIRSLPSSVDSRLRSRLSEGANRLADVVNSPGACETSSTTTTPLPSTTQTTTKKPKPKPKTTTSTTTSTTSTEATTSSTTPTPTTPTSPTGGTGSPGNGPVPPPGQRGNAVGRDNAHGDQEGG